MKRLFLDNVETMYSVGEDGSLFNNKTGKFLKPLNWSNGYKMYNIYTGSHKSRKRILSHRLVAYVYLGLGLSSKDTVNHLDGNKANNSVSNLEVLSVEENIRHAFATGLARGKCYRRCICEKDGFGYYFPSIHSANKLGFNTGNVSESLQKGTKLHGFVFSEL